jgi:hypothetical protein
MEVSGQISRPDSFTPGIKAPGTHSIGGWVGPSAGLNAVAKKNIPTLDPAGN